MDDLIQRQVVLDMLEDINAETEGVGFYYEHYVDYINALPPVKPQEPKTGHWIEHPEIETSTPEYLMFYECSECGDKQCFCKSDIHKKHFCNNCGARMVEPKLSENPTGSKDVIWYSKKNYSEIVVEPQESEVRNETTQQTVSMDI